MFPPEAYQPRLHQLHTLSMDSLGGYSDYEDPNRAMLPQQGQQRQRRRQPQGSEHVKHRRTRSGCYTCRQRRVKVSQLLMMRRDLFANGFPPSAMKPTLCARVRRVVVKFPLY